MCTLDEYMKSLVMCGRMREWNAALSVYYRALKQFGNDVVNRAYYKLPSEQHVFANELYVQWLEQRGGDVYLNKLQREVAEEREVIDDPTGV